MFSYTSQGRARTIIGNIDIIGKYRYGYQYIGSDISNIGIRIIGIVIGICYNSIIGYDIGIGISQNLADTMKYRY